MGAPVLGLGQVAVGSVLALHSSASIRVFVALVATGLLGVGITRIIEASGGGDEERSHPWITGSSGVLLVLAGIAAFLWPGATLPMLALSVAMLLLVSGATSVASLFTAGSAGRAPARLGGLAAVLAGLLVLFWPRLTLRAFGVFFGGWLRTFGRTAGSATALLVAVAMVLVTSFVHAGDPRLVTDAFYTPPTDVHARPGRLLRVAPLTEGIPAHADAWRILYTTTNPDGSPATASGSVVVPRTTGPAVARHLHGPR